MDSGELLDFHLFSRTYAYVWRAQTRPRIIYIIVLRLARTHARARVLNDFAGFYDRRALVTVDWLRTGIRRFPVLSAPRMPFLARTLLPRMDGPSHFVVVERRARLIYTPGAVPRVRPRLATIPPSLPPTRSESKRERKDRA